MNKLIYSLSDIMSQPIAFVVLTGATIAGIIFGVLMDVPEGYWTNLNLAISVTTMAIGQAVLVSSRRDGLAYHLKMDQIIEALPRDNEAIGVEHEDEKVIEQKIEETEERTQHGENSTQRERHHLPGHAPAAPASAGEDVVSGEGSAEHSGADGGR